MKYADSVEKSAEYLRLALPLMTRQAAALHPVSYAVWYEYVSGGNAPLKAAIDAATANGAMLDENATTSLYHKHIADIDVGTAHRISAGFQKVLAGISQSAAQAGDQAHQFGSALEQWVEGMDGNAEAGVGDLLRDTRQMQGAIGALKGRLDESRREIEQLRQEVSRAREDALADGLTGLTNRRGFDIALSECLAEMEPDATGPSILITDIDHFKKVNDTYGHLFGDKVIRSVAQILKSNVKGKDIAARYGGEEFVILLPDTPLEGACTLAERIRTTVEKSRIRRTDNNEVMAAVTVSLGVAHYRPGEDASAFVERADSALYASKNGGRNRVTAARIAAAA